MACGEWTGSIVRDIVVYPESEPCNTLEDLNTKCFSDMVSVQVRAVSNDIVVDIWMECIALDNFNLKYLVTYLDSLFAHHPVCAAFHTYLQKHHWLAMMV